MKTQIAKFANACNFPAEAICFLQKQAEKIPDIPTEAYIARVLDGDVSVWADWKTATDTAGIPNYTAQLLLLVLCAKPAQDRLLEKGLSEELYWLSMKDIRYKMMETQYIYNVWGVYTDMSVGNVSAMAGVIAGLAVKDHGCSVLVGISLGLLFGLIHGFVTGICIARFNCNSWVTTYALMQVYRGIIFLITGGIPVALPAGQVYTQAFRFLGQYKLFGVIQFPIVMMIVFLLLFAFILRYTPIGRNLYCVGNNPEAARVSGINVKATIVFGYLCVGLMSALAGITFGSRVYSMQPNAGSTYGMDTIAACVVGGTRMSGGKGNVIAALMGLLIVYVIQNGLIMCGLDAFYHYIVTGLIMFFAVLGQTVKVRKT